MGARAKLSDTFQEWPWDVLTPDPAPLEGFVHSWTLCRGSPLTPLSLSPLAVPLLGTTVSCSEGKRRLKFLLLEKET